MTDAHQPLPGGPHALFAAFGTLSDHAQEALAFYRPRVGFPSYTPQAVLDELYAAGIVASPNAGARVHPHLGPRLQHMMRNSRNNT